MRAWLSESESRVAVVQTRNQKHAKSVFGEAFAGRLSFVSNFSDWASSEKCVDGEFGVVNLAGAPIADARWSNRRKKILEESRIGLTKHLIQQIGDSGCFPKLWINASAIGFYGTGSMPVSEDGPSGDGYASELCRKWESTVEKLPEHVERVILRFGVVLGHGGALAKLLPMYRMGLGGPIGRGEQGFSWVHIEDVVGAVLWCLESALKHPVYNVTAPQLVNQKEFAQALGGCLIRPSFVPTPAFVLRAILGSMAQELLIEGQFVQPKNLVEAGFKFKYPQLVPALENILSPKI